MLKTLATAACEAEMRQRFRGVTPTSPRQWGRMTAGHMVCHLADSYEMATGERPSPEHSTAYSRTVAKWTALYLPVTPSRGAPTSAVCDPLREGTRPSAFERDVARLAQTFESFVRTAREGQCRPHPYFGALSPSQWLRWGYLHTDHHLRQFGA